MHYLACYGTVGGPATCCGATLPGLCLVDGINRPRPPSTAFPCHCRTARPPLGLLALTTPDDGTPGIAPRVARLQFNIANPSAGAMKVYDIDDEKKLVHVYGLRMGQELEGEKLGEEFSGYVFRCVAPAGPRTRPLSQWDDAGALTRCTPHAPHPRIAA